MAGKETKAAAVDAASKFEAVQVSRRRFLRGSAAFGASSILVGAAGVNLMTIALGHGAIHQECARKIPDLPGPPEVSYNNRFDNLSEAQKRVFSECARERGLLIEGPLSPDMEANFGLVATLVSFALLNASAYIYDSAKARLRSQKKTAERYVKVFRPEWQTTVPPIQAVRNLERSINTLPPVGGKIPADERDNAILFPPKKTAEEQVDHIRELRRSEIEGGHVVQYSVQGRLPDNFKMAAIALILSNPIPQNWDIPFINTVWGKTAPLVHDGGNVQTGFNERWRNIEGRTDFFQRFIKYELTKEQIDAMEEKQLIAAINNVKFINDKEDERLKRELRFYQRSAFALHSLLGNTPDLRGFGANSYYADKEATGQMPDALTPSIRRSAGNVWSGFEADMRTLLRDNGAERIADTVWFTEKPEIIPEWEEFGPRHEAFYPPIKRGLKRLESVKEENQGIVREVHMLMDHTSDRIDRILGLQTDNFSTRLY